MTRRQHFLGWAVLASLIGCTPAERSAAPAAPERSFAPTSTERSATPTTASATDAAACYDADRGLVTHVVPTFCTGEVIDREREAALLAERARRIEAVVAGRRVDPITGNLRLGGTGSGFFIGPAGELLTNNHVIAGCEQLTVTPEGGHKMPATLIATDPGRDIALLRAPSTPVAFARFNAAPRDTDGRALTVAGYPAYGLPTIHPSIVKVSAMPLLLATTDDEVVFEGAIRRGHSGSPVLDGAGNVIGIVRAKPDIPRIYKATGKVVGDYGIAVSLAATLRFLAQQQVRPTMGPSGPALAPGEAETLMRSFVAQIGCWR
jgi:S1-C subfamily serine protease